MCRCVFECCCQKEELVDADKNDESVAKGMLSDATQIDRLQTELHDLNRKINSQSSKLSLGLCSEFLPTILVTENWAQS